MDHNSNLSQAQAKMADGRLRYNAVFPKGTKDWVAKPIAEPKSYEWHHRLTKQVVLVRLGQLEVEDVPLPAHIPQNIAGTDRPEKELLVKKHLSRFTGKSQ